MSHIDKRAVLAELSVPEFLRMNGFEGEKSGPTYRYKICPDCGPSKKGSPGKFWARADFASCNSCKLAGDLFVIAEAVLGLSLKTDFPKLLQTCADLAGVTADYDPSEAERKMAAQQRQREEDERAAELFRKRAENGAPSLWADLPKRSRRGQEYLASRGVLPQLAGSECRYTSRSVCLPLWRDGRIVNIVGRRFDGGQPKIRGLDGCGTRGTFGRPALRSGHRGPIIICEGFTDYLSARQLSPTRLVLGAHGCGRLVYVAQVAAEIIKGTGRGVVLCPDQDPSGLKAMGRARDALIEAGVGEHVITQFVVCDGAKDLNDHLASAQTKEAA